MTASEHHEPTTAVATICADPTAEERNRLGSFIRHCRTNLKYTSRDVSRLAHDRSDLPSISNSYLISVEHGKHIPRLDRAIALADVLNVPVSSLVQMCREDLVTDDETPLAADFAESYAEATQIAAAGDSGGAIALLKRACDAARRGEVTVDAAALADARLQIARWYQSLGLERIAKEEAEALLNDTSLPDRYRARAAQLLVQIYAGEDNQFLARTIGNAALPLARSAGDERIVADLLAQLRMLASDAGARDEAMSCQREVASKLSRRGDRRGALRARTRQGLLMIEQREFFKAIELLRAELADSRERDPQVRGWLHIGLAKAYFGAENYKSCRTNARAARDSGMSIGDPELVFLALFYLWRIAGSGAAAERHSCDLTEYRRAVRDDLREARLYDRFSTTA